MKKKLLLIVAFAFSIFSFGQGLKADGTKIVNQHGEEVLLRGVGPGGWQIMEGYMMQTSGVAGSQHEIKEKLIALMGEEKTETFFEKWRENHFTKQDVDSLAAWGFNSIRIPMHYNLFTLPIEEEPVLGEHTWIETGFELIDDVLAWAAPHDIYVILDMHATPGGQGSGSEINDYDPTKPSLWESEHNKEKLVALWTRIADRYKDNPWIGGYDLINETHWDIPGGTALRNIYEDITAGIRSVDTAHMLFIEGNWYANDYTGLTPPWDDNLVYSFHKYWSYNNANDLDWILWMRDQFNVPLWMGESGENSNTWFTDAVSLFEENNIGWAWWTMRKIGDIDSPYAVDINPGYQKILDYWNGNGSKPSPEETFDGMMQLAENLLVENSHYRKDVPDALIRQVQTTETKPYNDAPMAIPGVVYMADFDLGRNNFAYYDTDVADYHINTGEFQAWNRGWAYRNDGVDIEKNEDVVNSNGFHIAHTAKGEWTKYTVAIEEAGVYSAKVRVASERTGGTFYLSLNDEPITKLEKVTSTGSWTNFTMLEVENINLEAGTHGLKFHFNNDIPFNISSIEFERKGDANSGDFEALLGETGASQKSIELALSEPINTGTLENSVEDFEVIINNLPVEILSVNHLISEEKDRSLVLNLKSYFLKGDAITVSYNGTIIKSSSDKILNTFTDLPVANLAPEIAVIPGKIEVEDYSYMEGLVEEDTEDEGGGKNFGYTDPGDFADYQILVPVTANYSVFCRVAGYDAGKLGFYSVNEAGEETELAVVTTVATGGWQTWKSVRSNMELEEGIQTIRMKIIEGGFNFNWFEFGYPDLDKDGVFDDVDQCPNTPEGATVDINGCELFTLPNTNYMLKTSSETCSSSNNGFIDITVENTSYTYTATISRDNYKEATTFSASTSFESLSAGTYEICFTIAEQVDYEQCFNVVVVEPAALKVEATKQETASKITVKLEGGERYFVTLNNETIVTSESEIELELTREINELKVVTNKDCQGEFAKTFYLDASVHVYPNPVVENKLFVQNNLSGASIERVEIYSVTGALLKTQKMNQTVGVQSIDVTTIPRGVFIVRVITSNQVYNFKVLK